MRVEIRPPAPDELDAVFAVRAQAFAIPGSDLAAWRARARLDQFLGAFVGGRLAGTLQVHGLGQHFGGRAVPMGGVASVAVVPEHRGEGLAPRLLQAATHGMRDRGEVISSLHPATTRVYRDMGWELGGSWRWWRVPTRSLGALPPGEPERVRRGRGEDRPALLECYARVAPRYPGWIDRPDWFWSPAFELRDDQWYLYVFESDSGDGVDGYVLYEQRPSRRGWGHDLRVRELVAADAMAATTLWRIVSSSASQVETVLIIGGSIDYLRLVLPEQDVEPAGGLYWMTRLVDGPAAIAARGFPPGLRAEVHVEVRDRQAGWNDGRFVLAVDGGTGSLEPGGTGDVHLTVNAFSSFYTGFTTARELATAGLLRGRDAALAALDSVFAGPRPSMIDDF